MACRRDAPSLYLINCWNIVNWTHRNKLLWNFNRNWNIFIRENAFEYIVCEMASILSRPQRPVQVATRSTFSILFWVLWLVATSMPWNSARRLYSARIKEAILYIPYRWLLCTSRGIYHQTLGKISIWIGLLLTVQIDIMEFYCSRLWPV